MGALALLVALLTLASLIVSVVCFWKKKTKADGSIPHYSVPIVEETASHDVELKNFAGKLIENLDLVHQEFSELCNKDFVTNALVLPKSVADYFSSNPDSQHNRYSCFIPVQEFFMHSIFFIPQIFKHYPI